MSKLEMDMIEKLSEELKAKSKELFYTDTPLALSIDDRGELLGELSNDYSRRLACLAGLSGFIGNTQSRVSLSLDPLALEAGNELTNIVAVACIDSEFNHGVELLTQLAQVADFINGADTDKKVMGVARSLHEMRANGVVTKMRKLIAVIESTEDLINEVKAERGGVH